MDGILTLALPRGRAAVRRVRATSQRPLWTLAGALPGAYALASGCKQLSEVRPIALDPDAITFLQLADGMTVSNVFNGWREPLWPALLVLPTRVLGVHPTMVRLLGLAGFVLMVVAFQALVGRLYGRTWGIVGALVMAASPWLVYQSARGLREEASTGLVIAFVTAMIAGVNGRRFVLLSAAAGLMALLRWDTVMLTVPTLMIAAIVYRPRVRHALQASAVFVILVAPMLIAAKIYYGTPLYFSSTLTPTWFRNLEFAGKPGFITRAEFQQNGYGGKPITWIEYFTQVLTPTQSARRAIDGLTTIPLTSTECSLFFPACPRVDGHWPTLALASSLATLLPWLGLVAGVVGAALLIRRRGTWPIPVVLALSILTFAPIAKLLDPRLTITSVPFLLIGVLECLHLCLRRRAHNRQATPSDKARPDMSAPDSVGVLPPPADPAVSQ
jgi:hypothetical protein